MEKKKNAQVDFSDKRTLFLLIGICISLSLTLLAFEYKSVNEPTLITWNQETDDKYLYEPPITVIEPPKPPI
jgi:protein TonB